MLSEFDPPDSAPAELLVRQLNKTLVFESEMVVRFQSKAKKANSSRQAAAQVMVDDNGDEIDPESAEGVRRRYRERADTVRGVRSWRAHTTLWRSCCCPSVRCGPLTCVLRCLDGGQETAAKREEAAAAEGVTRNAWLASLAKDGAISCTYTRLSWCHLSPVHLC